MKQKTANVKLSDTEETEVEKQLDGKKWKRLKPMNKNEMDLPLQQEQDVCWTQRCKRKRPCLSLTNIQPEKIVEKSRIFIGFGKLDGGGMLPIHLTFKTLETQIVY